MRSLSHYLLTPDGEFDRGMIMRRSIYEHQRAVERGDDKPLSYWAKWCWRCARGQKEAAAWSRVEARARAAVAERDDSPSFGVLAKIAGGRMVP